MDCHAMNREAAGVLISDGQSFVRLKRAGAHDAAGYPTSVEIKAGPFSGAMQISVADWVYKDFLQQLAILNETLSDSAQMGNPHDNVHMIFVGNGFGAVEISVEVISFSPLVKLFFELKIDQTYLPAIIAGFRQEFDDT
jgi:hypothetical protein